MANRARTVADVIAAEAVHGTLQQRFNDMVHIASVIANRATLGRVTPQQVVAVQREFNSYNKTMPPGTKALRGLAQRAIAMVEQNGPITPATYYATPTARNGLPKGLKNVAATKGHIYAIDPENRSFKTQIGYVNPSESQMAAVDGVLRPSADVAPNPNSYRVAHSRQFMPPDRQMPTGPVTASLQRQPGPGMAALAPNGLANPLSATNQRGFVASYGPNRPNPPQQSLIDNIGQSVRNVLGPNSAFYGTSGQQSPAQLARIDAGKRASAKARAGGRLTKQEQADRAFANSKVNRNERHPTGLAMDTSVKSYDPTRQANSVAMEDIGMDFAARNGVKAGVGFGPGYMGPNTLHLDTAGIGGVWGGGVSPQYKSNMQFAKETGIGPTPTFGAPTPTQRPEPRQTSLATEVGQRQALAAAMEKAGIRGLGATSQVAPVGQVERQSLPPDRQMPSGTPARQALAPDRPMPTTRPNLSAALEKRGITSSAPSEALAPDRQMPTGPVRPNLSAALEKAKISTVNDSQPAKVDVSKTRVNPVTGEVQPGLNPLGPIQAYPSVSTVAPTNVAPIRTTLTPTGQIATRPKATPSVASQPIGAIPSQPISPVTQQPRVVQPVQPRIVQPVQTPPVNVPALPNALSQQDFNSRYASPTPGLRASDVYGGAIGSAYSTGGNIVSRENSYGPTTVTNKYGVTTATMPDGKQAAYGKGPNLSGLTGAARPAIGGLAGGALGSLVGGPVGGIIGGLLGRQVASGQTQQAGTTGGLGGLLGGLFGGNQGNSSAKGSSKSSSGGSSKSSSGGSSRENNKPGGGRSTRYN